MPQVQTTITDTTETNSADLLIEIQRRELKRWFKESMKRCAAQGQPYGRVPMMRNNMGTRGVMTRTIMHTPLDVTPLRVLKDKNLLRWSFEAGVLRFPDLFPKAVRIEALRRYNEVADEVDLA